MAVVLLFWLWRGLVRRQPLPLGLVIHRQHTMDPLEQDQRDHRPPLRASLAADLLQSGADLGKPLLRKLGVSGVEAEQGRGEVVGAGHRPTGRPGLGILLRPAEQQQCGLEHLQTRTRGGVSMLPSEWPIFPNSGGRVRGAAVTRWTDSGGILYVLSWAILSRFSASSSASAAAFAASAASIAAEASAAAISTADSSTTGPGSSGSSTTCSATAAGCSSCCCGASPPGGASPGRAGSRRICAAIPSSTTLSRSVLSSMKPPALPPLPAVVARAARMLAYTVQL